MQTAAIANSGASTISPAVAPTRSSVRLRNLDGVREARGGKPDKGDALDRMQLRVRSQHLEQPRDDVDLDAAVLELADHLEGLLVRVIRERNDDSMRRVRPHELGKIVGRADQLEVTGSVGGRAGAPVDEADDVQAVFGVLADLAVEELRHISRTDDDHVLNVGRVTPADDADRRSDERNEQDRRQPKDDEPRQGRVRQAGEMRDREEGPGSDRDDLEDAEDVVDGGVIASLLVPVVEGVCAREKHP